MNTPAILTNEILHKITPHLLITDLAILGSTCKTVRQQLPFLITEWSLAQIHDNHLRDTVFSLYKNGDLTSKHLCLIYNYQQITTILDALKSQADIVPTDSISVSYRKQLSESSIPAFFSKSPFITDKVEHYLLSTLTKLILFPFCEFFEGNVPFFFEIDIYTASWLCLKAREFSFLNRLQTDIILLNIGRQDKRR